MKRSTLRKHMKAERRLIRLAYRTGLINAGVLAHNERVDQVMYWASYRQLNKCGKKRVKNSAHLPEIHFGTYDSYAGDGDEYAASGMIIDQICWFHADKLHPTLDFESRLWADAHNHAHSYPIGWFIRYMRNMPVVRNDHAINAVLRRCVDQD